MQQSSIQPLKKRFKEDEVDESQSGSTNTKANRRKRVITPIMQTEAGEASENSILKAQYDYSKNMTQGVSDPEGTEENLRT